ncbi:hypothetical protein C8R45DRAFT_1075834 [Mycena sanguinolenta]|nr:hypothetical protein C8R45DRAFT_1075834 [Mycena sanguinolenta]
MLGLLAVVPVPAAAAAVDVMRSTSPPRRPCLFVPILGIMVDADFAREVRRRPYCDLPPHAPLNLVPAAQPLVPCAATAHAYLAADMLAGFLPYRSQIGLITAWIHHLVCILITEVAIRAGWAHLFCLAAVMVSTLVPRWRSNVLFAVMFGATRIAFHLVLLYGLAMVRELRTPATILALFRGCIAGFVRRRKARVTARNSAGESVVVQKTPTEIGIDGSDKSGSPPRTSSSSSLSSSLSTTSPSAAGKPVSAIVQSRLDRLRVLSSTLLERERNGRGARWLSGPAGWVSPGVTMWLERGRAGGRLLIITPQMGPPQRHPHAPPRRPPTTAAETAETEGGDDGEEDERELDRGVAEAFGVFFGEEDGGTGGGERDAGGSESLPLRLRVRGKTLQDGRRSEEGASRAETASLASRGGVDRDVEGALQRGVLAQLWCRGERRRSECRGAQERGDDGGSTMAGRASRCVRESVRGIQLRVGETEGAAGSCVCQSCTVVMASCGGSTQRSCQERPRRLRLLVRVLHIGLGESGDHRMSSHLADIVRAWDASAGTAVDAARGGGFTDTTHTADRSGGGGVVVALCLLPLLESSGIWREELRCARGNDFDDMHFVCIVISGSTRMFGVHGMVLETRSKGRGEDKWKGEKRRGSLHRRKISQLFSGALVRWSSGSYNMAHVGNIHEMHPHFLNYGNARKGKNETNEHEEEAKNSKPAPNKVVTPVTCRPLHPKHKPGLRGQICKLGINQFSEFILTPNPLERSETRDKRAGDCVCSVGFEELNKEVTEWIETRRKRA